MLEVSREELAEEDTVPDDLRGIRRVNRRVYLLVESHVVEPIATGLRFLKLVFIFVPVILTVPVMWFGGRVPLRDNERTGALWWYQSLVSAMEHAGPAFIKVPSFSSLAQIRGRPKDG